MYDFEKHGWIRCGILASSAGGYSEIFCDPTTGDCVFADEMIGNMIFENITVTEPMPMETAVLAGIVGKLQTEGVICMKNYYILLKDETAQYMALLDGCKIEHTVEYDLTTEFDPDEI